MIMFGLPRWEEKEENWYALFTLTGEEDNVKERLTYKFQDEFRVLVPKRRLRERKDGVWSEKIRTLFPGYVLINGYINDEKYYKLKDVPGLISILKSGQTILHIEDEEIEVIKRLVYNNDVIDSSQLIIENKKIFVIDGPLKNMEGIIVGINKRKGRAKVRLNFLGEPRVVELGVNIIKPV